MFLIYFFLCSFFLLFFLNLSLGLFFLFRFSLHVVVREWGEGGTVLQRRKNIGLRRQAASHLQHPRGPAEVSRLLSVSDARVWSVDMEEMSLMEEEGGRLSLLFTAAPVLRE